MKEAYWGYFIVALGIVITVVLIFVENLTTTSEEDYYLTREILEASMIDAVDYGSYRTTGKIVMSKEKFEEVFIRRFAESVKGSKNYTIDFYDIYEDPPKATVRISTSGGTATVNSEDFGINVDTIMSGILEDKNNASTVDIAQYLIDNIDSQEDYDYALSYVESLESSSDRDDLLRQLKKLEGKTYSSTKGQYKVFTFTN